MATLQNKRILVIDDAPDILQLLKSILTTDGAEVSQATNVDHGLEMAIELAPHMIICDLTMPEKTGFEFLKMRRESAVLKGVPTMVLSGLNDRASVSLAVSLGATDYLLKPIKASLLLQKVRKCLNSSSFLKHSFQPADYPTGTLIIPSEVISLGESGLQIESAVKFVSNEAVNVNGEVMGKLGCENTLIRTAKRGSVYSEKGRYVTDLNFVGLSAEMVKEIRNRIKDWK